MHLFCAVSVALRGPPIAMMEQHRVCPTSAALCRPLRAPTIAMLEQIPKPDAGQFPFRTAILALLSLQSAVGLAGQDELAGVVTHFADPDLNTDYFGTLVDTLFLSYGANILLSQVGIIKESPTASELSLNDMECQITLSVGREPGTWMPRQHH